MEYPLLLEGTQIGTVRGESAGNRMEWTADCPFEEGWIYRVYLGTAEHRRTVYLGVMMPQSGRFVLRKMLSADQCGAVDRQILCGHVVRHRPGESEPPEKTEKIVLEDWLGPLPFSVSALEPVPEKGRFADRIFAACGGRYVRVDTTEYYLAPGCPGEQLGPSAFFCLLTWVQWNDGGWWVLCVDGDGRPFALLK